jgi:ankyrin repeat protein
MTRYLSAWTVTAFLLILSVSTIASATPFTDAVMENDPVWLDSLLTGEDAAKQMNRKDDSGYAPIHYVINMDLRTQLSSLISAGVDLEVEDPWGRTPLLLSAARGDAEVTGFLLRRGAETAADDDAGLTALHYGVISGSDATVDTMLTWGLSVDAVSDRDQGPLTLAVIANQPDMVNRMLTLGANPNLRDETGMGPLHHSIVTGNAELVTVLLDQFAEINLLTGTGLPDKSLEGATALHLAIAYDHAELAEQLILAGASTTIANKQGNTPLMLAIRQAPGSFVSRLLVAGASQDNPDNDATPLTLAIELGDAALLSSLIDHGADLNKSLPNGDLPLLATVRRHDLDLVNILLVRGAHPDTTADKQYPLEIALVDGRSQIALALLESNANPNRIFAGTSGAFSRSAAKTPLSIAVKANSLPMTRLLLDHGAAVNLDVTDWDASLLEQAVVDADLSVIRLLVAEGASITPHTDLAEDAVGLAMKRSYPVLREVLKSEGFAPEGADRDGNNYLHLLTEKSDDARLIIALVAAGVDISKTNASGRTPLHEAARRGKAEMTRALLEAGADATMLDSKSKTALNLARGGAKTVLLTY